jgi:hypothetical protein
MKPWASSNREQSLEFGEFKITAGIKIAKNVSIFQA